MKDKRNPLRIFRELRWEVFKTILVSEILNAAILFFTINLIGAFFSLPLWIPLGITLIWLAFRMTRSWRKNTVAKIEEGNPEVHEILRTAYDHRKTNTLMMQALMHELTQKMSTVSTGVLLSPKSILGKFITVLVLAITPIIILGLLPQLIQANPLENISLPDLLRSPRIPGSVDDVPELNLNYSDDIYGDPTNIIVGEDSLTLDLTQSGAEGTDFSQLGAPEAVQDRYANYPNDVYVPTDNPQAIGEGLYNQEEQDLITTYSCKTGVACQR